MASTPQETLHAALQLPERTEVEKRTKISRLYYALYSHACNFHDALGHSGLLLKRDVGSHKQLTQKLTNPTTPDQALQDASRQLGTKQQLAHDLRLKADYDLHLDVLSVDLAKCKRYVQDGMAIPVAAKAAA